MWMAKYREDEYFWSSASMLSINGVTLLVTNALTYRGYTPREKARSSALESQQPALSRVTGRRGGRITCAAAVRCVYTVSRAVLSISVGQYVRRFGGKYAPCELPARGNGND